jgi:hypothetical protein
MYLSMAKYATIKQTRWNRVFCISIGHIYTCFAYRKKRHRPQQSPFSTSATWVLPQCSRVCGRPLYSLEWSATPLIRVLTDDPRTRHGTGQYYKARCKLYNTMVDTFLSHFSSYWLGQKTHHEKKQPPQKKRNFQ